MNHGRHIFTALSILLLLSGTNALAQQGSQTEHVRRELERTDVLLGQAEEAVRVSANPLAEQMLREAQEYQKAAYAAFSHSWLTVATNQTRKARDAAQKALKLSRVSGQLEGVVLRHLEKAGDLLDRLGEHLAESHDRPAEALYENARTNLSRAWEFYNNGQYRPALKLADQAEKTGQRLAAQLTLQDRSSALYQRRRDQVQTQLDQAQDLVQECDSQQAREHMIRAREAFDLAEELSQRDNPKGALQALKRSQNLITRALSFCQGSDRLEARYERLKGEADRLAEELSSLDQDHAASVRRLLDQVYDQLAMARRFWDGGQTEQAAASLQAAQLALRQAQRYISGDL